MRDWEKKFDSQLKRLGITPKNLTFGKKMDSIKFATADITLENADDWQNILHDPNTGALTDVYGNTRVVYMKDHTRTFTHNRTHGRFDLNYEHLNKVHLTWCGTLQKMEDNNRYDRYVGTPSRTNLYSIEAEFGNYNEYVYLRPCIQCLKKVDFDSQPQYRKKYLDSIGYFDRFHIRDWFEYCDRHNVISPKPTKYTPETYPPSGYTEEFKRIANELKQRANYICQQCSKDFSGSKHRLDCHHINGVRGDNRPENLKVLCVDCHRQQPNHEHYNR